MSRLPSAPLCLFGPLPYHSMKRTSYLKMLCRNFISLLGLLLPTALNAFVVVPRHPSRRAEPSSSKAAQRGQDCAENSSSRRKLLQEILVSMLLVPTAAQAGIDPSALKALPVEGDTSGGSTRLNQIAAANQAAVAVDRPWEELSSGVSYREYREGRGDACECFW